MDELIVPFSKKTWSEIIFEKLKLLIEDAFWKPGEKIYTEAELCEKFNVSRSTVREAINMLKANNLVYAVPGAGTFVSNRQATFVFASNYQLDLNSEKALLDVMELRLAIEPYGAGLAAARISGEELDRLRVLHERYAADLGNGPEFFAATDMAFHMYIAQITKNALLMEAMSNIKAYLQNQLITSNHVLSHRAVAFAYHTRILEAICKQNTELAEIAMREHMSEAFQFMLSLISSVKSESRRLKAASLGEAARSPG
ncbi:MAG: FadR family transcriptional regulator [Planctomycetota bacterium]|jgi:DNA-binding FadR family transcriptional regulator|nr:FadR family transcriptional regulator [Planctomycetota bacterium]